MAIITRNQVKAFLNISGSTYDTIIDTYIPYVQRDYIEICNPGYTKDEYILISAVTIAFANTNPDTITDSDSGFVDAGFEAGQDVVVEGSESNDGEYTLDTVAAGTLTLATEDQLATETAGEYVSITRIKWVEANLPYVAKMIWHHIANSKTDNVQSESLSRYSVTYKNNTAGYPESIIKGLKAKNVRMS